MSMIEKEIIRKKIRDLHVLSQEEIVLVKPHQVSAALHDIADILNSFDKRITELERRLMAMGG